MSWINVGIAAVGVVTSVAGGAAGSAAANKAGKAQSKLTKIEYRERLTALYKQKQQLLGIQQTGYAAAGVDVTRGTPKALEEQLNQDLAQTNYYEAMKLKYTLKGASAASNAASSGYLSQGLSQGLSFAGQAAAAWPK
jgi:hypothetical protein